LDSIQITSKRAGSLATELVPGEADWLFTEVVSVLGLVWVWLEG